MSAVLDTFESRHRHRDSITRPTVFVYTCPRCEWVAPAMRYRQGAERHGDEHALVCAPVTPAPRRLAR